MKRIDVSVDGVALPSTGDAACPEGSCERSRTVTLSDAAFPIGVDGMHTITATAYDHVGHSSTASFQLFMDRVGASTSDTGPGDGGEISDSAWGEPTASEECTMDASSPGYCAAGQTSNTSFMEALDDPPIEDVEETTPIATASSGDSGTSTSTPRPKYGIAHYDGSFLDAANPNARSQFRALKVRRVRTLVPFDLFDYSRNDGKPNNVQNRDLTNFRSFLSNVAAYNGTYSSEPLRAIIGINASGDRAYARTVPSRELYRTNFQKIRAYIDQNYPQARVGYYEAWNEPNDAGHTLRDSPRRAAEFWKDAHDLCGTECTVLAGDFTDNGDGGGAAYFQAYRTRLLELRDKLPTYWGYHPYKYGLHGTDGYLRRFKSFAKAAGKNARIWFTEYGAYERLRDGTLVATTQTTQLRRTIGLPSKAGTKKVKSLLYYSWVSNQQGVAYDTGLLNNNGTPTRWDTLTNGSANDDLPRPVYNSYKSYTNP